MLAPRLHAQAPAFNRQLVVLDPAHGGADTGARISDQVQEKDVTLAIAARLRSLLAARGFTVVSTRENAGSAAGTTDQRAEQANRSHAVACLVIHASASGNGVEIGISTIDSQLAAISAAAMSRPGVVTWERAQQDYLPQSLRLANQVGAALVRSSIPVAIQRVAMRPLDNLTCPAVVIELGTLRDSDSDSTPVWDAGYQQKVVEAIAGALVVWRNDAQPPDYVTVPRSGPGL